MLYEVSGDGFSISGWVVLGRYACVLCRGGSFVLGMDEYGIGTVVERYLGGWLGIGLSVMAGVC